MSYLYPTSSSTPTSGSAYPPHPLSTVAATTYDSNNNNHNHMTKTNSTSYGSSSSYLATSTNSASPASSNSYAPHQQGGGMSTYTHSQENSQDRASYSSTSHSSSNNYNTGHSHSGSHHPHSTAIPQLSTTNIRSSGHHGGPETGGGRSFGSYGAAGATHRSSVGPVSSRPRSPSRRATFTPKSTRQLQDGHNNTTTNSKGGTGTTPLRTGYKGAANLVKSGNSGYSVHQRLYELAIPKKNLQDQGQPTGGASRRTTPGRATGRAPVSPTASHYSFGGGKNTNQSFGLASNYSLRSTAQTTNVPRNPGGARKKSPAVSSRMTTTKKQPLHPSRSHQQQQGTAPSSLYASQVRSRSRQGGGGGDYDTMSQSREGSVHASRAMFRNFGDNEEEDGEDYGQDGDDYGDDDDDHDENDTSYDKDSYQQMTAELWAMKRKHENEIEEMRLKWLGGGKGGNKQRKGTPTMSHNSHGLRTKPNQPRSGLKQQQPPSPEQKPQPKKTTFTTNSNRKKTPKVVRKEQPSVGPGKRNAAIATRGGGLGGAGDREPPMTINNYNIASAQITNVNHTGRGETQGAGAVQYVQGGDASSGSSFSGGSYAYVSNSSMGRPLGTDRRDRSRTPPAARRNTLGGSSSGAGRRSSLQSSSHNNNVPPTAGGGRSRNHTPSNSRAGSVASVHTKELKATPNYYSSGGHSSVSYQSTTPLHHRDRDRDAESMRASSIGTSNVFERLYSGASVGTNHNSVNNASHRRSSIGETTSTNTTTTLQQRDGGRPSHSRQPQQTSASYSTPSSSSPSSYPTQPYSTTQAAAPPPVASPSKHNNNNNGVTAVTSSTQLSQPHHSHNSSHVTVSPGKSPTKKDEAEGDVFIDMNPYRGHTISDRNNHVRYYTFDNKATAEDRGRNAGEKSGPPSRTISPTISSIKPPSKFPSAPAEPASNVTSTSNTTENQHTEQHKKSTARPSATDALNNDLYNFKLDASTSNNNSNNSSSNTYTAGGVSHHQTGASSSSHHTTTTTDSPQKVTMTTTYVYPDGTRTTTAPAGWATNGASSSTTSVPSTPAAAAGAGASSTSTAFNKHNNISETSTSKASPVFSRTTSATGGGVGGVAAGNSTNHTARSLCNLDSTEDYFKKYQPVTSTAATTTSSSSAANAAASSANLNVASQQPSKGSSPTTTNPTTTSESTAHQLQTLTSLLGGPSGLNSVLLAGGLNSARSVGTTGSFAGGSSCYTTTTNGTRINLRKLKIHSRQVPKTPPNVPKLPVGIAIAQREKEKEEAEKQLLLSQQGGSTNTDNSSQSNNSTHNNRGTVPTSIDDSGVDAALKAAEAAIAMAEQRNTKSLSTSTPPAAVASPPKAAEPIVLVSDMFSTSDAPYDDVEEAKECIAETVAIAANEVEIRVFIKPNTTRGTFGNVVPTDAENAERDDKIGAEGEDDRWETGYVEWVFVGPNSSTAASRLISLNDEEVEREQFIMDVQF